MITEYVVGFAFHNQYVALIEKKHGPPMLVGKWNGIGGHIEPGELPLTAMVREFGEETGVYIAPSDWRMFCTITGDDFTLYIFKAFTERTMNVMTKTDEVVSVWNVKGALEDDCQKAENLNWLIPMALNDNVSVVLVNHHWPMADAQPRGFMEQKDEQGNTTCLHVKPAAMDEMDEKPPDLSEAGRIARRIRESEQLARLSMLAFDSGDTGVI